VLLPFGGEVRHHAPEPPAGANPLLARVDPALGPALTDLGCALVWATTWGEDANASLGPRLGLPRLPVVGWPEPSPEEERQEALDARAGRHWKTRPLVAHAAGRPFVWLDDELGDADRRWVAAHHPAPALLHAVDPARGIRGEDLAVIRRWLRSGTVRMTRP
jgi:hypothetical protein